MRVCIYVYIKKKGMEDSTQVLSATHVKTAASVIHVCIYAYINSYVFKYIYIHIFIYIYTLMIY